MLLSVTLESNMTLSLIVSIMLNSIIRNNNLAFKSPSTFPEIKRLSSDHNNFLDQIPKV